MFGCFLVLLHTVVSRVGARQANVWVFSCFVTHSRVVEWGPGRLMFGCFLVLLHTVEWGPGRLMFGCFLVLLHTVEW